jgi:hypothetical protein
MKQKGLGVRDVERNAEKRIGSSHVSKILGGTVENLTAGMIVALAKGLQVKPHEVFTAISGDVREESSSSDLMAFAELIQQMAANPTILEAMQELQSMEAKDQAEMLEMMKFVNERARSQKRKKKRG